MYAIFEYGSRQYRVEKDSIVLLDFDAVERGQTLELGNVLLYQSGADTLIGRPVVEGAKVIAEVLDNRATKKTMTQKFRRRKASKRLKGHTQPYIKVLVKHILKAGEAIPTPPPAIESAPSPTPTAS
jgi:large subunit ribosomal protein L21